MRRIYGVDRRCAEDLMHEGWYCAFSLQHIYAVLKQTHERNPSDDCFWLSFGYYGTRPCVAVRTFVVVAVSPGATAADRMAEPAEVTAACAPAVESPDADAVELCGRFVSGLLQRFRATGDRDCRCPATAVTFADKLMARSFDRLYDMMSHDLLRAADGDVRARPPPQLRLYDDLGEFTRLCSPLHEINRHAPPSASVAFPKTEFVSPSESGFRAGFRGGEND